MIHRIIGTPLVLLAVGTIAHAALASDAPGDVVMPPERMRGDASASVVFVSDLNRPCGNPPPGKKWAGCVRFGAIYLPNPCPYGDREIYARIACHELAHVAHDWSAAHEAAAPISVKPPAAEPAPKRAPCAPPDLRAHRQMVHPCDPRNYT